MSGLSKQKWEIRVFMKIAHLSDLHICQKYRPKNLERTKILLDYALQQGVDHIVITGDVVHLGDIEDYVALRNLLEEFDLLNPQKLTLVIGNHDVFGGVYLAEDILAFPEKCESINYKEKLKEFKNYFFETFENTYFPSKNETHPFKKIVDDVILIGINSTTPYSKVKNLFASRGKVGKKQIENLRQVLSQTQFNEKVKIVLIHHHFKKFDHLSSFFSSSILRNIESFGGKLRKKKRLLKLFKKHKIDLILHGHDHNSVDYWIDGLHFMNAGGCIDKNRAGELKINIVEIVKCTVSTEVRTIIENQFYQLTICQSDNFALTQ